MTAVIKLSSQLCQFPHLHKSASHPSPSQRICSVCMPNSGSREYLMYPAISQQHSIAPSLKFIHAYKLIQANVVAPLVCMVDVWPMLIIHLCMLMETCCSWIDSIHNNTTWSQPFLPLETKFHQFFREEPHHVYYVFGLRLHDTTHMMASSLITANRYQSGRSSRSHAPEAPLGDLGCSEGY